MARFTNGTKLPRVGKMKASTMMKAVEKYMKLGNNMQIKLNFDKYEVVGKPP